MEPDDIDGTEPPEEGPCHFCKKVVKAEESFCYGCKIFVCQDCDHTEIMGHGHNPAEHQEQMS